MSIVGIVGAEATKFTAAGEAEARRIIRKIIRGATGVASGACHLGGIDKWAIEEAEIAGVPTQEFPPAELKWETGFKPRNLQIVAASDEVHCIAVKRLPDDYDGMRFARCYHCNTTDHVKSGGCWTAKKAEATGKVAKWHFCGNEEQS